MKNIWHPQDQVFWYLNRGLVPPCNKDMHVDVAIVGGGIAGLSAAQAFHKRGKKVALFEQYYCGSGASGKSSGFITPNAELSLADFAKHYGDEAAQKIWDFILSGMLDIKATIENYSLSCDYIVEDTLVVANSKSSLKDLEDEYNDLIKFGYKGLLYDAQSVRNHIGSSDYYGGVVYSDSFGIDAYAYCQQLKQKLQELGVMIFEETPVTSIDNHTLKTLHATITADYIVVCTDRFTPDLGLLTQSIYHIQTFLMISQVLTDQQMQALFPERSLMVWDTDLIYTYFRISNKRLLLGGGNLLTTYSTQEHYHYQPMVRKLTKYFERKFPHVPIQFEHIWPGLIGVSKDIAPIAGRDKDKPFLYYVAGAAGLPIAAALGRYSAEHLIDGKDDLDAYFSPYRKFLIGGMVQSFLGNRLSFALSNFFTKY